MFKPFPFHPLNDSLFGKCMLELWMEENKKESRLLEYIQSRISPSNQECFGNMNGMDNGFYCTSNATKELIYQEVPDTIRKLIKDKNYKDIELTISKIAQGKWENQKYPGLDIAFELLEWLLTGFEEDEVFIRPFLSLFPGFNDQNQIKNLKQEFLKHYQKIISLEK